MSESTTPIDIASIKPGQLVSGRFTNGGTFTDVPVVESPFGDAVLLKFSDQSRLWLRERDATLSEAVAEVTAVRDPRPVWADDPTAILIDSKRALYRRNRFGYWYSDPAHVFTHEWMLEGADEFTLFGHRVAEDES